MKNFLILVSCLLSGCSVLSLFLSGDKCDSEGSFLGCVVTDGGLVAQLCEGGFKVLRSCPAFEECIPDVEDTKDSLLGFTQDDYDGCSVSIKCGDGVQDANEECDDGNDSISDDCVVCRASVCGDGAINFTDDGTGQSKENCEPEGGNCNAQCKLVNCTSGADCEATLSEDERGCFQSITCSAAQTCELLLVDDGNECTNEVCVIDEGLVKQLLSDVPCSGGAGSCVAGVCRLETCGDGVINAGEQCDDGNAVSGDGCDANCFSELATCGNSVVELGEECEDGNVANDDGCNSACQFEVCGDNIRQLLEQCDDGNQNNNDGCGATCQIESCGDGTRQTNEACDDGDANNNNLCTNACKNAVCGDGFEQFELRETCDLGPNLPQGNCSADCQECGDLAALGSEVCDGTAFRGLSCQSLGFDVGQLQCLGSCSLIDASGCQNLVNCGNGIVDSGESCDDGNNVDGDSCDSNCTVTGCGNGILTGSEQCDDGNAVNIDECPNTCLLPTCGDGIVQAGLSETCDDGNASDNDSCPSGVGGSCRSAFCGDGFIFAQGQETCDDGNGSNNDNCPNTCKLAVCGDGFLFNQNGGLETCDDGNNSNTDICPDGSGGTCRVAFCSDGFVRAGVEQCDDANNIDVDSCPDAVGTCQNAICGDGFVFSQGGTEVCDDANQNNGDTCNNQCQPNVTLSCPPTAVIPIGAPLADADNSSGTNSEFGSCGGSGLPEDAYLISLAQPLNPGQSLQISVTNNSNSAFAVYLRKNQCDDDSPLNQAGCANINSQSFGTLVIPEITISGDSQFFLFIDTVNGSGGLYDITVSIINLATPCGNGILDGTEECDDGNINSGDGCDSICQFESCTLTVIVNPLPNPTTIMNEDTSNSLSSVSQGPRSGLCPFPQNGNDTIFILGVNAIATSKTITAHLTAIPTSRDMSVAIKKIDCTNTFDTCDDDGNPNPGDETAILTVTDFTSSVFIFVDSKDVSGQGPFTLSVTVQ